MQDSETLRHALFTGPGSLRDPSERIAFWATALLAFPAALSIGFVLHESIGVSQVALFIVIAMIYVTIARGRLLGSSVRVHETQYPRVFAIVKRTCAALDIPMPLIFVREDNYVPVVALGFGEPYALVLSSHWIEAFEDDELAFMVGRELGHIAAGHTRFLSLLSVNGNENPLISLIFGAWLRRCTFTCDKVGLLCCGSIDAAIRAMGVAAFHHFGRKIDYRAFAEQRAEVAADPVLRMGAWLGSEPYATERIVSLQQFIETHAYEAAEQWFLRERDEEPPALPAPGTTTVVAKDCAGWWRRLAAYAIDSVVVTAIIAAFGASPFTMTSNNSAPHETHATASPSAGPSTSAQPSAAVSPSARSAVASTAPSGASPAPSDSGFHAQFGPVVINNDQVFVNGKRVNKIVRGKVEGANQEQGQSDDSDSSAAPDTTTTVPIDPFSAFSEWITNAIGRLGAPFWLPIYLGVLVGIAGQTFGMMIAGLRVVTTDFRRPGPWRTIWRYLIVAFLWWLIAPCSLIWRRVLLQDLWSGTRVVKVERMFARSAGPLTK